MEGILAAPSSDGRRPSVTGRRGFVPYDARKGKARGHGGGVTRAPAHPVVVLRTREQERKERGDGPVHGAT